MRERNVTPHVSENANRSGGSALDRRTTRHAGYQVSQRKRKRIRRSIARVVEDGRHVAPDAASRNLQSRDGSSTFAAAAYNLVRMRRPCDGSSV